MDVICVSIDANCESEFKLLMKLFFIDESHW